MNELENSLKVLDEQERILQFDSFTNKTALEIGMMIVSKAAEENKAITVDICKCGQQIFHFAFDGTSPDNDIWIKRKNNVVTRFHRRSLGFFTKLKLSGQTLEDKYGISLSDYAPSGGAFPVRVKNVGVIGTITVSGLKHEQDHEIVVEVLKEYLKTTH
jgi:uncharacterized protein (UPF0303 family)